MRSLLLHTRMRDDCGYANLEADIPFQPLGIASISGEFFAVTLRQLE